MSRITIEDVAKRSGVSTTTVSHVFSGHRPVSAGTRRRVRAVAEQLGYSPNGVAKSLRMRRTDTVMVIIPDITNPFYPAFARGVQDVLRRDGYHTMICNTDAEEAEERSFLDEVLPRRLDGVIFMGFRVPPRDLLPLAAAGPAVVNLGPSPGGTVDSVRFNDRASSREATAFLLDRTSGAVAFIGGTPGTPVARARLAGFRKAYADRGLAVPEGYLAAAQFTRRGGAEAMSQLLNLPGPPRAVFCANDLIAIGALDVLTERGFRIPQEVAVVGCDDIEAAAMVTPSLTTVRHPAGQLGSTSAELLLSRMTGAYDGPGRQSVISHQLIVRDSA